MNQMESLFLCVMFLVAFCAFCVIAAFRLLAKCVRVTLEAECGSEDNEGEGQTVVPPTPQPPGAYSDGFEYKYVQLWSDGKPKDSDSGKTTWENHLQVISELVDDGWQPVREIAPSIYGWHGPLLTFVAVLRRPKGYKKESK